MSKITLEFDTTNPEDWEEWKTAYKNAWEIRSALCNIRDLSRSAHKYNAYGGISDKLYEEICLEIGELLD